MGERLTRRELLASAGTASTVAVAGCQSILRPDREPSTDSSIRAPPRSAVGDPLPIQLVNFEPNTSVLLEVTATDSRGIRFLRTEGLRTDDDGTATLTDQGFGWIRRTSTWIGSDSGRRLGKRSTGKLVFRPMRPRSPVRPAPATRLLRPNRFLIGDRNTVTVRLEARYRGQQPSAAKTIARVYIDSGVARRSIEADDLVGWLYTPLTPGSHPGVIVLHGSEAIIPHQFSRMLATHGYTTLALQYFGAEGLPPYLRNVPLEYFDRAVQWLTNQPAASTEGLGFVGISRGIEAALLTAAAYGGPTAVIGYSGSGAIAKSVIGNPPSRFTPKAAWTRSGKPIAPAEPIDAVFDTVRNIYQHRCEVEPALDELRTRVPNSALDRATAPVEEIDGPILLFAGSDDQQWPAPPLSALTIDRLKRRGCSHPYGLKTYCGAGHIIGLPYQRYSGQVTSERFGGEPTATARAAASSWLLLLAYLQHGLRKELPLQQSG